MRAKRDGHAERGVGAQVTRRKFSETIGDQFMLPGRRQHRQTAGRRQGQRTVFLQRFQMDIATDDNALVSPRIGQGRRAIAQTAAHIDAGASRQIVRQTDLFIRLNTDGGRTTVRGGGNADSFTAAIEMRSDFATRHHQTGDIGILRGGHDNLTVGIMRHHTRRTRHTNADVIVTDAAMQRDQCIRAQGAASFYQCAMVVRHHPAQIQLSCRVDRNRRWLVGPAGGLRQQDAGLAEGLLDATAGQNIAGDADVTRSIDRHHATRRIGGETGCGQTADRCQHD